MEHLNYARFNQDTNEKKYDSMFASQLPKRPGYNTAGKEIQIRVNQFKVLKYPQKDIFQYDVSFIRWRWSPLKSLRLTMQVLIGSGGEKRGLVKAVWESNTVQSQLKAHSNLWIWNGDKIAW